MKISLYPLSNSGKRTSYLDCFTTGVDKITVDNEAKIDIRSAALSGRWKDDDYRYTDRRTVRWSGF
ncbi:hypothetical protein ACLBOM_38270 [Escherichia coli]